MIYIDPPYNTGKDFIYRDNFKMDDDDYNAQIELFDDDGNKNFTENLSTNPLIHSDWCSMIYARLLLAKNLLTDDGVIFISIDDNEQANLKKICDEVFGEKNFVATFPWRKRSSKSDVPFGISQDFEWVICYAKEFFRAGRDFDRKYFETEDFPNQAWRTGPLTKQTSASERPNSYFTMINPKTGEEFPASKIRTWAVTKETFQKYYDEGKIIFPGDYDFLKISTPVMRYWKADDIAKAGKYFGKTALSTKFPDSIGMSQDGTKECIEIFGGKIFSFPKPVALIKFLINIATDKDALVLDFFSGSATTAHAVMELNSEDGGNRKFIMVQLPEVCAENSEAYKAGYKNICEIGKERIRRAGIKLNSENLDVGFRVLKSDTTNFRDVYFYPEEMTQEKLIDCVENIKSDRNDLDLLFDCLLKWGIELTLPYCVEEFEGVTIHRYGDEIIACFDENISREVFEHIAKKKVARVIFRDGCFTRDDEKMNARAIFNFYSPNTKVEVL